MKLLNHKQSIFLLASALIACPSSVWAAVSYTTAGSTYTQSFDSLPTSPENASLQATKPWADDTTQSATLTSIIGWYLYHPTNNPSSEGGTNGHQRLRIGPGSSSTGAFYSFGASGNGNRALGDLGANTLASDGNDDSIAHSLFIAVRLTNNTGAALDTVQIGYTGEQWRYGGNTTSTDRLDVGYSLTATSVSDDPTAFTSIPSLTFTSLVNSGATGGLDGTAAANQTVFSPVTISGLDWEPGTDLWIRWTDPEISGNDDGMAIDNFNISAIATPEPASLSICSLAAVALLRRRRSC